ncbi:ABC1 family-domain-containing protein [Lobosporangium transversale]|uniref:ABC1 family-domain-containing protein n=1 Tax=Lobosporangium transversale TaxID=64571 RepID=A0A1Y2GN49_9FUNG|nr:ABC1 family-domain-containing protein [Lobosporangium transversale]ORZ13920.1 ABC1 family-domain-containing protein [Lobosporangium transversale]|eukprot:XP_021880704.1 ABC1 family-domain-containing protein [Lobosporangium transversale]
MPIFTSCRAQWSRSTFLHRPRFHFTQLRYKSIVSSPAGTTLSIGHTNPSSPRIARQRFPLGNKTSACLIALTTGAILYNVNDPFRHVVLALKRMAIAGAAVTFVGIDYKYTMDTLDRNQNFRKGSLEGEAERARHMSELHTRSAVRLREMLRRNGGIYIKLGQHLASMTYLLPDEWTTAMEPLQDRCAPSSFESVQRLFLNDLGQPLSAFFSSFDLEPIGVASLAQVHRARLLDGQEVAVKIQHPALQEFSAIDIKTVAFLTNVVANIFPDFQFKWLSDEMETSLPRELNFNIEAANAARVDANFYKARAEGSPSTIKIPEVIWSKKRVLVMEFIHGSRIDNLQYLKDHNIEVSEVSNEMARTFSQMIYKDGFVHCDPHPGNVLIRPKPTGSPSPRNFEIILLDHGLYRELTPEFRLNYARLWTAIIASDEKEIKYRALKVGGTEAYKLFSSILTGRDWSVVKNAQLTKKARGKDEMIALADGTGYAIAEIAQILARVPRELLLLFKTNDLLRALDEDLGADDGSQMRTFAVMGQYCAHAIYESNKMSIQTHLNTTKLTIGLATRIVRYWIESYCSYMFTTLSLDLFMWWIDLAQSNSILYRLLSKIENPVHF